MTITLFLLGGCSGRPASLSAATANPSAKTDRIESIQNPAVRPAPGPIDAPAAPVAPMIHDSYSFELAAGASDLYVEKHFTFVGPVIRVGVRYLSRPQGDVDRSTFESCEVEVEAPVVWNTRGFSVTHAVTSRAQRVDFERLELPADDDGSRNSNTSKSIRKCWVTLLPGDYRIENLSRATTQGRTKSFTLIEPDGEARELTAVSEITESSLVSEVDAHFWD